MFRIIIGFVNRVALYCAAIGEPWRCLVMIKNLDAIPEILLLLPLRVLNTWKECCCTVIVGYHTIIARRRLSPAWPYHDVVPWSCDVMLRGCTTIVRFSSCAYDGFRQTIVMQSYNFVRLSYDGRTISIRLSQLPTCLRLFNMRLFQCGHKSKIVISSGTMIDNYNFAPSHDVVARSDQGFRKTPLPFG